MGVCVNVYFYVLVCFQKCHDLQGTSEGYPTSQHNTVSTSPFDDLSPAYMFYINNILWNRNN